MMRNTPASPEISNVPADMFINNNIAQDAGVLLGIKCISMKYVSVSMKWQQICINTYIYIYKYRFVYTYLYIVNWF